MTTEKTTKKPEYSNVCSECKEVCDPDDIRKFEDEIFCVDCVPDEAKCDECDEIHETEDDADNCCTDLICSNCSGSGEGMHDGSTCRECRGNGTVNCKEPDDREPEYDPTEKWEREQEQIENDN